ncbi:PQQ-dependent sugar dehydrogenase [Marinoscillum sp. MHG1-6]|uniref:PQQ-dependent sugar dehydrogenase n=1 Tax=Marinoscillum sp. MHG1-6 TaxID=2959627 RepID=UPI0021589D7F|nr:PQQ-dependent sugar dehydrogenase [Marinoscillum sp. MHG1-6]
MYPKSRLAIIFTFAALIILIVQCQPQEKEKDYTEEETTFTTYCSGCHGGQMQAFVDRNWKFGNSKEELINTITNGNVEAGMPTFGASFTPEQIAGLADYIRYGIENVEAYKFQDVALESDTFKTAQFSFHLDTVFTGGEIPWGMDFFPDGAMIVTDRSGTIFHVGTDGKITEVSGGPQVLNDGQGGLLDVIIDPNYAENGWIYMSYSDFEPIEGERDPAGTAVDRMKLSDSLTIYDRETIFKAAPYSGTRHHYGSRLEFDNQGYLYVTVGDRGARDQNPQSLASHCGKVHRINPDGSIPESNPFIGQDSAVASIYSYGHRNPQGMDLNPETGKIWTHEHGPRGGDEINEISSGLNYGWPIISYGLNYNGTTFTNLLAKEGMEQPNLYWVPSIAPSGLAFVTGERYPGWKGHLLAGSLRFKYLNLCYLDGNQITKEERLMENIGRVRNVKMGPEDFIYVSVENPGYIFKLIPISD